MDPIRTRLASLFADVALLPRGKAYDAARFEHAYLGIRLNALTESDPRLEEKRAAIVQDIERIDAAVVKAAARLRNGGPHVSS